MKSITIKVNQRELTVPEGTLLIDACEQNGIPIPHFCYHHHLFPSGNCRLCLVQIEKNPKPVPACMTPVAENMVVWTETPEIRATRKAILEFILINHPLDCPICDKAGECMLQDQYMAYSGDPSHFRDQKHAKGKLYKLSDRILYDAERCILCSRCIRFTQSVSKTNKLGIIKRGDRGYVAVALGDTFTDAYSYCVTDICPVGALTNRQFRFKERVWNLQSTPSICAGCSRGCNIWLEHHNQKLIRVMPRSNDAVNQDWMCDFGRDFYVQTNPEARLTGCKIGGEPTPYSNFIAIVAEILKTQAKQLAFILSSHATNEELALAQQLCQILGIKSSFKKADREWQPNSVEIQQDDFLITADKTPNLKGLQNYFPQAVPISDLKPVNFEYVFVWGNNAPAEKLGEKKIIMVAANIDPLAIKAHWLLAGRLPAEKSGSFTNAQGLTQ
ncbi:2Fe-2S iron-sulfur cluster-binding protein, partial [candidate division KSB1 bacterium]|nr:2Fe-2S iron-sulfur cluster-binding protein [candidate division KSB1 bacterium]